MARDEIRNGIGWLILGIGLGLLALGAEVVGGLLALVGLLLVIS